MPKKATKAPLEVAARDAAAARAELEAALNRTANLLIAMAAALGQSANELAEAAQKEAIAAGAYTASLERQISQQRTVS